MEDIKRGKPELLAPAGNMECLKAAVNCGADAVYFAGRKFGARASANNFDDSELREAVEFCRLFGVKTHITVNTLVSDRELVWAEKYLRSLEEIGADAVIVQDFGIMRLLREMGFGLKIHASTQMSIHNLVGVLKAASMGADRVVLARELSRENIEFITKNSPIETEVFVHGAMCMSYSGQCLMSSMLGGRSGNRGMCAGTCRLPYGRDKKFYLSLKDMSYINHIGELTQMGVSSFKIEGRMKGAAYVGAVVETWRRCIDEMRCPTKKETETLDRIFYRGGLSDNYYMGKTGAHMFALDKPDNPYEKGDKEAEKVLERLRGAERKRLVCARLEVREGSKPSLKVWDDKINITINGENNVQTAKNIPLTVNSCKERLCKTGGTPFEFDDIEVKISGRAYLPASELNELRRRALEEFYRSAVRVEKTIKGWSSVRTAPNIFAPDSGIKRGFSASVRTEKQYEAVKHLDFDRIYLPIDIAQCAEGDSRAVVSLPAVIHDGEDSFEKLKTLLNDGFKAVEAQNIGQLDCGAERVYGSHRLNVFSAFALAELKEQGLRAVTLSPEMNLAQIRDMQKNLPVEVIAYGRLPLMISENCIIKNLASCPCRGGETLTDRRGAEFPIIRDGSSCRSVLLNSVPVYMADKTEELFSAGISCLKLCFTTESAEECRGVSEAYLNGGDYELTEYTRAHFYKGVL